jgi:uncharacterized protein (TIGR03032 family)
VATDQKLLTKKPKAKKVDLDSLWHYHHWQWRNPHHVITQWQDGSTVDPKLLKFSTKGKWWETLAATKMTLIVGREYEHLLIALSVVDGKPSLTYMTMPHPSGIAFDTRAGVLHIASTRNPNQIFDLAPVDELSSRLDADTDFEPGRPLIPVRTRFFPGCLYMHDLAMIDNKLYANAVGQNAVVRLDPAGTFERVWWPKSIEIAGEPVFGQNHLQLNSIAAGKTLSDSFFSASCQKISARRPGHKNFPVDKLGVIFSGKTREPCVVGLTRPHSARLIDKRIWVDNSGYGELGYAENGQFVPFVRLSGWTRGLYYQNQIAFVGTSRVIPRYKQYAPGLDVNKSKCALHAIDLRSGEILGSLIWTYGNQIFAIEGIPSSFSTGFAFSGKATGKNKEKNLFYAFSTHLQKETGR